MKEHKIESQLFVFIDKVIVNRLSDGGGCCLGMVTVEIYTKGHACFENLYLSVLNEVIIGYGPSEIKEMEYFNQVVEENGICIVFVSENGWINNDPYSNRIKVKRIKTSTPQIAYSRRVIKSLLKSMDVSKIKLDEENWKQELYLCTGGKCNISD